MKGLVQREFTEQQRLAYELLSTAVEQLPDRDPPLRCHELAHAAKQVLDAYGIKSTVIEGAYGLMTHSWLFMGGGVFLDVYAPAAWPLVQLLFVDSHGLPKRYRAKNWRQAEDVGPEVTLHVGVDEGLVDELSQELLHAAREVHAPCDVGEGLDDERVY